MKYELSPSNSLVFASVGAIVLFSACTKNFISDKTLSADESTVCFPHGSQIFSFDKDGSLGQGVNDAIHAIKGSGAGPGDACWSEAEQAAKHAIGPDGPQIGMEITIPAEVIAKK